MNKNEQWSNSCCTCEPGQLSSNDLGPIKYVAGLNGQLCGKYEDACTMVRRCETPFVANDSNTINFTHSGTLGHTLTGSVIISQQAGNAITENEDGLYVPDLCTQLATVAPAGEATPQDTQLIGADCQTYTLPAPPVVPPPLEGGDCIQVVDGAIAPRLAATYPGLPAGCNGLQCTADGLAAPPPPLGVTAKTSLGIEAPENADTLQPGDVQPTPTEQCVTVENTTCYPMNLHVSAYLNGQVSISTGISDEDSVVVGFYQEVDLGAGYQLSSIQPVSIHSHAGDTAIAWGGAVGVEDGRIGSVQTDIKHYIVPLAPGESVTLCVRSWWVIGKNAPAVLPAISHFSYLTVIGVPTP